MTLDCSPYNANQTISQQMKSNQLFSDGSQHQEDEDDQLIQDEIDSFEDQVNKIVASPNQASLFMEEQTPHIEYEPQRQGQVGHNRNQIQIQAMPDISNQQEEYKSSPSQQQQQFDCNNGMVRQGEAINNQNSTNPSVSVNPQSYLIQNSTSFSISINSAFKLYNKHQHLKAKSTQDLQQQNLVQSNNNNLNGMTTEEEQKGDNNSIFSISENILMMLTGDYDQEESLTKKEVEKPKRDEQNIVFRVTKKLVETIQICNPRFNYQPLMNPKRDLTLPSEGVLNNGYDNIENDYILRVGDMIVTPEGREYEIQDLMGRGTFGQVVKCQCKQTKELVAVKVIKNKKAFKNQGVIEIKILDILNRVYDPIGETPIVKMLDFFVFRNHLCIVFELLSASLFDLLKENQFKGVSLNFSRLIISKILEGMKVIKEARLIHCDLKPENILFKTKENFNIKIIDLGSACFEGFAIFQYIQSRYYRSPEVLLGLPYDTSIDMWSLGCICAELFLGIPIFPGNSEYDQLSRIIDILGLPAQNMIAKAKFRDKYFIFNPDTMTYRFKTFDEFQVSTGIRLEVPKQYTNISCLDDLKIKFIQKKSIQQINQAIRDGQQVNMQNFQPRITDSEMNTLDAFIDFLKGVLRIDKEIRWTPTMAMGHPFIKRNPFTRPFEPAREVEKRSNTETGDDSMSERSASSRDSKDYKAGSCPSKILYPQTATLPQYLQHQQDSFSNISQNQFSQNMSGNEYAFHGQDTHSQSHRPPILSIPEEYFKGFMFGRLDQILSMTRDQLLQFVYEQNEMSFRQQQAQKMQIMQQQQFLFQQQQQMLMNNQLYQQYVLQQNQMQSQLPQQQQIQQQFQPNRGMNQPNIGQAFNNQMPQPMDQAAFNQMMEKQRIMNQYQVPNINLNQAQIALGAGGQYLPGQMPNQQAFVKQLPPQQFQMQQFPQKMIIPNEQIIINPPPYQLQKSQLAYAAQFNDPNYNEQMQQQRPQGFKSQGMNKNGAHQGKPGSWQPPQGIQQQKYNHYYNQINNPGQLIGRQTQIGDYQQQFIHQNVRNNPQQRTNNFQQQEKSDQMKVGSFSQSDFKKLRDKKPPKFAKLSSSDQIASSVIIEENQLDHQTNSDKSQQEVPFPINSKQFIPYTDANQFQQKEQYFPLFQDNFALNNQYHQHLPQQQMVDHQMKLMNQVPQIGGNNLLKQYPSPKIQSSGKSFIMNQKNQSQPQTQLNHSRNQSLNNGSLDSQSLNSSFTQNQTHAAGLNTSSSGGKGFLKKFEQSATMNQSFSNQGQDGKVFINNNHHHHQYRLSSDMQAQLQHQKSAMANTLNQSINQSCHSNVQSNSFRQRSDSDLVINDETAQTNTNQQDQQFGQVQQNNYFNQNMNLNDIQQQDQQTEEQLYSARGLKKNQGFDSLKEQSLKQSQSQSLGFQQQLGPSKGAQTFRIENIGQNIQPDNFHVQHNSQQNIAPFNQQSFKKSNIPQMNSNFAMKPPIQQNFRSQNQVQQQFNPFNNQFQQQSTYPQYQGNQFSFLKLLIEQQFQQNPLFQPSYEDQSIFSASSHQMQQQPANFIQQQQYYQQQQQLQLQHQQQQMLQSQVPLIKNLGSFKKEGSSSFKKLTPIDEDSQNEHAKLSKQIQQFDNCNIDQATHHGQQQNLQHSKSLFENEDIF